jgi:hypothetical protein
MMNLQDYKEKSTDVSSITTANSYPKDDGLVDAERNGNCHACRSEFRSEAAERWSAKGFTVEEPVFREANMYKRVATAVEHSRSGLKLEEFKLLVCL